MTSGTFGDWLAYQLKRRDLSQTDFGTLVGSTQSAVSRWIRNERVPDPESCDRIADALGVDLDVVLLRAGHRPVLLEESELVRELCAKVRRIAWTGERELLVRGILDSMLSLDRDDRA